MNKLLTIDEFTASIMADIEEASLKTGSPQIAWGIVFGAILGAPIDKSQMEWAFIEIANSVS